MSQTFQAFRNDSQSVGLGELTLENQGRQVNLYGSATFTVDQQSLTLAKDLQAIINDIVSFLEQQNAEKIPKAAIDAAQAKQVDTVDNPFL